MRADDASDTIDLPLDPSWPLFEHSEISEHFVYLFNFVNYLLS